VRRVDHDVRLLQWMDGDCRKQRWGPVNAAAVERNAPDHGPRGMTDRVDLETGGSVSSV
jgi:hypothetical protein